MTDNGNTSDYKRSYLLFT